jgi:hypothetical protein
MAAKTVAYVYRAMFPAEVDAPRPAWPVEVLERALELDDVVDATFADVAGAWAAAPPTPLREERRRVVELVTVSATPAAADVARGRIRALLRDLAGPERIVVTRAAVDVDVL